MIFVRTQRHCLSSLYVRRETRTVDVFTLDVLHRQLNDVGKKRLSGTAFVPSNLDIRFERWLGGHLVQCPHVQMSIPVGSAVGTVFLVIFPHFSKVVEHTTYMQPIWAQNPNECSPNKLVNSHMVHVLIPRRN